MKPSLRSLLPGLALLALACGQTHAPDPHRDAGAPDAGPCGAPRVNVLVRSDYAPGEEVVSIVVELNDVIRLGRGVRPGDDLAGGVELGTLCEVPDNSRITVRFLDGRGAEVVSRVTLLPTADDGSTVTVVVPRS